MNVSKIHYSVSKEEEVTQFLSLNWLWKAGVIDDGMSMVLQINHSYLSFPKKVLLFFFYRNRCQSY